MSTSGPSAARGAKFSPASSRLERASTASISASSSLSASSWSVSSARFSPASSSALTAAVAASSPEPTRPALAPLPPCPSRPRSAKRPGRDSAQSRFCVKMRRRARSTACARVSSWVGVRMSMWASCSRRSSAWTSSPSSHSAAAASAKFRVRASLRGPGFWPRARRGGRGGLRLSLLLPDFNRESQVLFRFRRHDSLDFSLTISLTARFATPIARPQSRTRHVAFRRSMVGGTSTRSRARQDSRRFGAKTRGNQPGRGRAAPLDPPSLQSAGALP